MSVEEAENILESLGFICEYQSRRASKWRLSHRSGLHTTVTIDLENKKFRMALPVQYGDVVAFPLDQLMSSLETIPYELERALE